MISASEQAIASTRRELAEYDAIEALCNQPGRAADDLSASNAPTPGGRRRRDRPGATRTSAVLSVRLDYDLMEALERRAALAQIAPSTLARNLIRFGMGRRDAVAADLVDDLEALTARFRTAMP